MANLITTARLVLLFVLVVMAYAAPPAWQLLDPALLLLIIALDAVDGYVARARGETSVFGSVYDIAVDRVVENVLWIVLADLELAPTWVALLCVTRGLLVDAVRGHAADQGHSPFSMMRTALGRSLVAGRFMRGLYGTVKALAFAWLLLLQPLPAVYPAFWAGWAQKLGLVGDTLILCAVALCVLRGLPVLVEFYGAQGRARRAAKP